MLESEVCYRGGDKARDETGGEADRRGRGVPTGTQKCSERTVCELGGGHACEADAAGL